MKAHAPRFLMLLAAVALMPASILLVAGVVFFIGAVSAILDGKIFLPDGRVDYEFLYISVSYVVGIFAVWQLWVLAIATAREQSVKWSSRLFFAVMCGCIAAIGVCMVAGSRAFVFVVLPAFVLFGWLLHLQLE